MKLKPKITLMMVIVLVLTVTFFIWSKLNQELLNHTSTANNHIVGTRSFAISADSGNLNTSAKGTVFVKGNEGISTKIQIVAAMIEVGRDRNYQSKEGGNGIIIIDLVPDLNVPEPDSMSITIEVGSFILFRPFSLPYNRLVMEL